MSDNPIICGHCRKPIHKDETKRHYGFYSAHLESRCRELLQMDIAALRAEVDKLEHDVLEAESALWRIQPNSYTLGTEPDPFEGPGETYRDAYERLRAENERLRGALGRIACHHVTVKPLWWQGEARAALGEKGE